MSYIDQTLTSGERVLYRTRLHWITVFWPLFLSVVFGAGAVALAIASMTGGTNVPRSIWLLMGAAACFVIASLSLGVGVVRRSSTEMAVTNRRVLMKSGILSRKTTELLLAKVESIGVNQGVFGRMAGFGSIVVRGTGGTYELFDRVARPLEFRRQVQEQIDQLHQGGMALPPP